MLTQNDVKVIEEIVEEKISAKTKLLPTKEEFFSKMDEVMGELKNTRESLDLHAGQHADIHDEFEANDDRIKRLEKHLHIAPVV
jgi:predicted nuclease with TOPRIM domain